MKRKIKCQFHIWWTAPPTDPNETETKWKQKKSITDILTVCDLFQDVPFYQYSSVNIIYFYYTKLTVGPDIIILLTSNKKAD